MAVPAPHAHEEYAIVGQVKLDPRREQEWVADRCGCHSGNIPDRFSDVDSVHDLVSNDVVDLDHELNDLETFLRFIDRQASSNEHRDLDSVWVRWHVNAVLAESADVRPGAEAWPFVNCFTDGCVVDRRHG